jgi:hypothetical protein
MIPSTKRCYNEERGHEEWKCAPVDRSSQVCDGRDGTHCVLRVTCERSHLGQNCLYCHLMTNSRDSFTMKLEVFPHTMYMVSCHYGFLYFHTIWVKLSSRSWPTPYLMSFVSSGLFAFVVYWMTLSVAETIQQWMTEWLINWKGYGGKHCVLI